MQELELRIEWGDLDILGHVNNIAFFRFLQSARVDHWQRSGIYALQKERAISPLLVATSMTIKSPLFFPGNVLVRYAVEFVRTTSFGLRYEIADQHEHLVATATDAMVMFDLQNERKVQIGEPLRSRILDPAKWGDDGSLSI